MPLVGEMLFHKHSLRDGLTAARAAEELGLSDNAMLLTKYQIIKIEGGEHILGQSLAKMESRSLIEIGDAPGCVQYPDESQSGGEVQVACLRSHDLGGEGLRPAGVATGVLKTSR